jgi:hypothetical protein
VTLNNRRHERLVLHWRISVLYDDPKELELFYATTNSISMTGCSIYLERHILVEHPVIVQLTIPPSLLPNKGCEQGRDIKITALMKYGYQCRARHQFRVGLDFIEFWDEGEALLAEAFANFEKHHLSASALLDDTGG